MDSSIEYTGIGKRTGLRRSGSKEFQKKRDVEQKSRRQYLKAGTKTPST